MAKRQIFYSFHFDNDVMRVQQVRNMGALEENKPVSANEWEQVKKGGDSAIEKWIDDNMKYRSCVVVLVGEDTANRKWVKHEIKKAWKDGKGVVGIYVHNLKCPRNVVPLKAQTLLINLLSVVKECQLLLNAMILGQMPIIASSIRSKTG